MIRYEFTDVSIREEDIHPDSVFGKERDLAHELVASTEMPEDVRPCPICDASRDEILFRKWGLGYAICPETWTVSLATLPDDGILQHYFLDSELSQFRASRDYQDLVSSRRQDLWETQIGWMEGRVSRHLGNAKYTVVDWGGKFVGWIESLRTATFVDTLVVEEPLPPIKRSEDAYGQPDIVCLIDVLQRAARPHDLLQRVAHRLDPGGLLIVSCRSGSGFDILTLRDESESVFPLDHILLPSPKGMQLLVQAAGFDVLELTTPGLLDMKYLKNAKQNIPRDQYFQRYIVDQEDESLLERMQGFLQRNNLSSHLRCVARRK